jgi:chromosome segregation ATPase
MTLQGAGFSPDCREIIQEIIQAFLRRNDRIEWLEWLPIALVAAEQADCWVSVFRGMRDEDQFALLSLLAGTEAGPLADALLIILAEHAGEIEDEQVRQIVLEETPLAHERNEQRLRCIQARLEMLQHVVEERKRRVRGEIELAVEIERLQQELADIRSQECEGEDDRFAEIHTLENEILHEETRREILKRYDRASRERLLEELKVEVAKLEADKRELEGQIAPATAARDAVRRDAESAVKVLAAVQAELISLENTRVETQSLIDTERAKVEAVRVQIDEMDNEVRRLSGERTGMEKQVDEAREICRRERTRLEELKKEAEQADFKEIVKRITDIYRMLPPDRGDEGFLPNPRRRQ